ncbi:3,4-dihydroxyphenylacetate 2,3-dioxygenase [Sulfobacillus harzensis]|uniref:3,4-dihydroxyphenylacetate 2,3-dioxygenase n=1 Tax=Sulfobacillus harzensis TaxID=2729629 RepID=A0A7Y0Q0K1_9FIRM|nr:3,4-dihydroxyphenylacetate 2,3-dioxygenase [Sulfobacillus harzensis]NMP21123.1 3,4-dihydroxyphenylacetate 2,3-dioxygenase [Sulfobacillus harzensis]
MSFQVVRTSHAEYFVTDLSRARAFYVDTLGFVLTSEDEEHLYLRGLEDRVHHNLVLTLADHAGAGHVGFRVASPADLDELETLAQHQGLFHQRVRDNTEFGVGDALRVQDPFGFPIEFFYETRAVPWMLQAYDAYHGAAVMRLDHVNYLTPDIGACAAWYQEKLQFQLSEYTVSVENGRDRLWGAWLRRKQTSHDLAIANGAGPRFHHASFIAESQATLLRVADILAAKGAVNHIERGPGRHGTTNAFFLYLRDPDGNRIELFTGDYLAVEPDWQPVRWDLNDPRRATFWGAEAPSRWFNEAMNVYHWDTGEAMAVRAATLPDRPDSVD